MEVQLGDPKHTAGLASFLSILVTGPHGLSHWCVALEEEPRDGREIQPEEKVYKDFLLS